MVLYDTRLKKKFISSSILFLSFVFSHVVSTSALYYCGRNELTASTISAHTLSSPVDDDQETYPPGAYCRWTITAPIGKLVELKFTTFDTYGYPTCDKFTDDYLKIYLSKYKRLMIGKYCGSYLPAKVVSSDRYLTLLFKSSSRRYYVSKKGFRLQYRAIDKSDNSVCTPANASNIIRLEGSSVTKRFESPWYPNKYPSKIGCIWILSVSHSKKIKIKLKILNILNYVHPTPKSCRYSSYVDSLVIYDGLRTYGAPLKMFCSSDASFSTTTLTSSGRYLTITFNSNSDNYFTGDLAGFEVEYTEVDDAADSPPSSPVGVVVGAIIGVICTIGLIICCVCCIRKKCYSGHAQRPAVITMQATSALQHPVQPQGDYQPLPQAGQAHYPSQVQTSYARAPPTQSSNPPNRGSYPPPTQGSYPPPTQGSYPPPTQGSYPPPTQGSYPPPTQGSYPPPTQGSYPPPTQGSYPPSGQEGYPPTSQADGPHKPTAPHPVSSDPPPQYPGLSAYSPQAIPPYNPKGRPQQPPCSPAVNSKAVLLDRSSDSKC